MDERERGREKEKEKSRQRRVEFTWEEPKEKRNEMNER